MQWITSFFIGISFTVQVAEALSQETRIKHGVPQASVIVEVDLHRRHQDDVRSPYQPHQPSPSLGNSGEKIC